LTLCEAPAVYISFRQLPGYTLVPRLTHLLFGPGSVFHTVSLQS
jgi:hypothetical protein